MKGADTKSIHCERLFDEQVKLLYKNSILAYAVTLINGAILGYVQSSLVPVAVVVSWFCALVLVTLVRSALVWRYHIAVPETSRTMRWNIAYACGAAAAGLVWGAAAWQLFPPASIAHQVFVAFVLAGMAAGGVSVLAPRMEACIAFLLPALLPLMVRYFSQEGVLPAAMGFMTAIFFGGITLSALSFHRAIRSTLQLRFDKQDLEAEVARRNRAEEQLMQEKERLQTIVRSIAEGVVLIDANGCIEYLNPAAEELCGRNLQEAMHRQPCEVFEFFDFKGARIESAMESSLRLGMPKKMQSVLQVGADKRYLIEETATPLFAIGRKPLGAVSVFRDVTEAVQMTEQLAYAADHDVLTGLPNRNLLKDRTEQAIARAQRKRENFALLFLDLDQFKAVNDSMGHASGDALLVDVAKRLSNCVREEDTIARLGGDEFVVLLNGPTQKRQVYEVANKILKTLRKPFQLGERLASISASIGASLYPVDGQDAETLLGRADAAMYRAKKSGRNRSCL